MTRQDVSAVMAVLALATLVVAVVSGVVMDRRGWGRDLQVKIRLLFAVIAAQLVLTVLAPGIRSPGGFLLWVVVCSVLLGVGIPLMFSTMIDFIPLRDRGVRGGGGRRAGLLRRSPVPVRLADRGVRPGGGRRHGSGGRRDGVLSVRRFDVVEQLARQHERFGTGRFCRDRP